MRALLAAALVLPAAPAPAADLEVVVSYPPDYTLVTKADLPVEGYVRSAGAGDVTITVNEERPVRATPRDTVFVEEVGLEEGRNVIRVGSEVRRVWLATPRAQPPSEYKPVYGHFGLNDGCLECHKVEGPGQFALAGEREEICSWCHGDIVRGSKSAPFASSHAPVRAGQCLLCHDVHLSARKNLLVEAPPTCDSCHQAVVERLKADKYVHGPMSLGDCRLCHAVHGSAEPKLLARPATALCVDCHSDVRPAAGAGALRPHPMIPEGQCGRCHEPHSSENLHLLRQAPGRLCVGCHEGKTRSFHESKGFSIYVCAKCHDVHRPAQPHLIIDASRSLCLECHDFQRKAVFTHSFVTEGRCFLCHSFHEAALAGKVAEICLPCHRDNPRLGSAHQGLSIGEVRCTICHEPHQATRPKLMRSVEHTPFARKECAACHKDRADKIGGNLRPLCLDCHPGKDVGTLARPPAKVHPPFTEEDCAFCHRSHSADAPGVLRESQAVLCLNCHRALRKALLIAPASAHEAVTEGRCSDCHDAHFSDNPTLLRRPPAEICPSCHAAIVAGPEGAAWPQPHKPVAEGKCRLCHKPHTSSNPALLKAPSPQACRPCHVPFFTAAEAEGNGSRHAPVGDGRCAACHQVHGGAARLLQPGVERARCIGCHKELKDAHHSLPAAQIAAAAGDAGLARGCLFCHLPHASPRPRLLAAADGPCKACHKI